MIILAAVGGGERYPGRSPRQKDDCEAYGEQSWFLSKGLATNVVDGGRVMPFHIVLRFQDGWGERLYWVREGEYLEETAVKSDKIPLDQLVPGFQVVIEVHLQ